MFLLKLIECVTITQNSILHLYKILPMHITLSQCYSYEDQKLSCSNVWWCQFDLVASRTLLRYTHKHSPISLHSCNKSKYTDLLYTWIMLLDFKNDSHSCSHLVVSCTQTLHKIGIKSFWCVATWRQCVYLIYYIIQYPL